MRSILVAAVLLLPGCIHATAPDQGGTDFVPCHGVEWRIKGHAEGAWPTIRNASQHTETRWRHDRPAGLTVEPRPSWGPGQLAMTRLDWNANGGNWSKSGSFSGNATEMIVPTIIYTAQLGASDTTISVAYGSHADWEQIRRDAAYFFEQTVVPRARDDALASFLDSAQPSQQTAVASKSSTDATQHVPRAQQLAVVTPTATIRLPSELEFAPSEWAADDAGGGDWRSERWYATIESEFLIATLNEDGVRQHVILSPSGTVSGSRATANGTAEAALAGFSHWTHELGLTNATVAVAGGPARGPYC